MKVDVSARIISIPRSCACCGDEPTTEIRASATRKRGKTEYTNSWSFPYCQKCSEHVGMHDAAIYVFVAGLGAALLGALFFSKWWAMALPLGAIGAIALYSKARSWRGPACVCTGQAVAYRGWHGSLHSFVFFSQPYALQFMQANRDKLVNLTAAQHQLLGRAEPGEARVERAIRRR